MKIILQCAMHPQGAKKLSVCPEKVWIAGIAYDSLLAGVWEGLVVWAEENHKTRERTRASLPKRYDGCRMATSRTADPL